MHTSVFVILVFAALATLADPSSSVSLDTAEDLGQSVGRRGSSATANFHSSGTFVLVTPGSYNANRAGNDEIEEAEEISEMR